PKSLENRLQSDHRFVSGRQRLCVSRGFGGACLFFGQSSGDIFREKLLHFLKSAFHRQVLTDLLDNVFYLDTVDGLLDEKFNPCFIGGGDHFFGRNLGEHNKGGIRQPCPCMFHEGDPVHLGHQKVHDDNIRF